MKKEILQLILKSTQSQVTTMNNYIPTNYTIQKKLIHFLETHTTTVESGRNRKSEQTKRD